MEEIKVTKKTEREGGSFVDVTSCSGAFLKGIICSVS